METVLTTMDIDEVACVLLQKRKVANMHHDSRRSEKNWFPRSCGSLAL